MNKTTRHMVPALAAILILSAGPATARTVQHQHQDVQQTMSRHFDHQTLKRYAAASVEVGKIENVLAIKLQTSKNRVRAEKMRREAIRETNSAIKKQGLDVPTYNKITRQIAVDQELRKEVAQIRKEGA